MGVKNPGRFPAKFTRPKVVPDLKICVDNFDTMTMTMTTLPQCADNDNEETGDHYDQAKSCINDDLFGPMVIMLA